MAGLYIHIPFCRSKCIYCDFFSTPSAVWIDEYIDALNSEFELRRNELKEPVRTIYIGGGTPSILSPQQRHRLIGFILKRVNLADVIEFTIEANPEDLCQDFIDEVRAVGINRVSIGVQTFNAESLKFINRRHSAEKSIGALELLRDSGLNYSADLIYGIPTDSFEDWERSLCKMLSFSPPHISAYLLSFEPGTRLDAMRIAGKVKEIDDTEAQRRYSYLISQCREAGYEHYEISNFALPGCHAVHNSSYWEFRPYLGLGVSAHSFDGSVRRYNPSNIKNYIDVIGSGKSFAVIDDETELNRFNDIIITSLRTSGGLPIDDISAHFGEEIVDGLIRDAKPLLDSGDLIISGNTHRMVIPEERWLMSDAILRQLIQV